MPLDCVTVNWPSAVAASSKDVTPVKTHVPAPLLCHWFLFIDSLFNLNGIAHLNNSTPFYLNVRFNIKQKRKKT